MPRRSATPLSKGKSPPYGIDKRVVPDPYLRMPHDINGALPKLLSQTGAFKDTRTLTPADGLIPYEIRVPFWSDGASKVRWVSVPKEKIGFSPTGDWTFPERSVFVKTFELPVDEANPARQAAPGDAAAGARQRRWGVWRRLQVASG